MRNHVNLMSDAAQFRAALNSRMRNWLVAWAVIVITVIPFAAMRWHQRRAIQQTHAALEAKYEPISRLSTENRNLRTNAQALVREQRIVLELSRQRPLAALLAVVSGAAADTGGELYVRQLSLSQNLPGRETAEGRGKLIVEAASTLTYDVSLFVKALNKAPFHDVTVLSTDVVTEDDVEHKQYTLECSY